MKIFFTAFLILSIGLFSDIPEGYYNGTEGVNGEDLKTVLHGIIDNHVEYSYDDLRDFILKHTDEDTANSNKVICLYTGWSYDKDDFGGGASDWNREHVWAKSHGDFGNNPPCGTDAHHIRPTDVTVNSRRGNLDFDNGGSAYTDGDGATGCYVDSDSWEPRDEVKGDVARMIFYMAVRYEGDNGEIDLEMADNSNSSPSGQPLHGKKSTLLEWHHLDPVSSWEIRRNDRVYEYQENRNPFIDHPEFVERIWEGVSTNTVELSFLPAISVYPNPFNPQTTVTVSFEKPQQNPVSISIFNIKGEKVKTFIENEIIPDNYSFIWNGDNDSYSTVSNGIYFVNVSHKGGNQSKKLMLLK